MEAATSVAIASLERVSFALSFNANNSIFSFSVEMYFFPERVSYTQNMYNGDYAIYSTL